MLCCYDPLTALCCTLHVGFSCLMCVYFLLLIMFTLRAFHWWFTYFRAHKRFIQTLHI